MKQEEGAKGAEEAILGAGAPPAAVDDQEEQTRISIPGDTVLMALNRLLAAGDLDDAGKAAILWFYGHARERGMTLADAGACIDRDASTVHRLFSGRYGAGYGKLLEAIARYRKLAEQRAKRKEIGYIETTTWRKISAVCHSALFDSAPAFIYGASQIGKTAALIEYARRNNHGQTRYVRMPAAPSLRMVLEYLAQGVYISARMHERDMRRRIMAALDDKTLLILDEFHQVMIGCTDAMARKIVEFIREVYDRTHCGLVICGTKVLDDEMEKGRQALVYDQFRRRGLIPMRLPPVPPAVDIEKIAAAFGLEDPPGDILEIIRAMLSESGLGKFIKFLQCAHGLAVGKGAALTWDHFRQVHKSILALARG